MLELGVLLPVVTFVAGALFGAITLYFVQEKFFKLVNRLFDANAKELSEISAKTVESFNVELETYMDRNRTHITQSLSKQQEVIVASRELENRIKELYKEVMVQRDIRVELENEIIKLKNILKRQNKNQKWS